MAVTVPELLNFFFDLVGSPPAPLPVLVLRLGGHAPVLQVPISLSAIARHQSLQLEFTNHEW